MVEKIELCYMVVKLLHEKIAQAISNNKFTVSSNEDVDGVVVAINFKWNGNDAPFYTQKDRRHETTTNRKSVKS